jgi:hypothetical protein
MIKKCEEEEARGAKGVESRGRSPVMVVAAGDESGRLVHWSSVTVWLM